MTREPDDPTPPGAFEVVERFAPDALESQVGKVIPLRLPDGTTRSMRIAAATTSDDGRSMSISLVPADGSAWVTPWFELCRSPWSPPTGRKE